MGGAPRSRWDPEELEPLLCSGSSVFLFRNAVKVRKMLCIVGAWVFYSNEAGGRRR